MARRASFFVLTGTLAACSAAVGDEHLGQVATPLVPFGSIEIAVDFGVTTGAVENLQGVNKGPLSKPTNCPANGPLEDVTYLYQRAGVRSVRLHDDSVDVSAIFTARVLTTMPGAIATTNPCYPQGNNVQIGHYLAMDVPSLAAANDAASYDYTNADAVYDAAVNGGFDVYLRLGESWDGPSMTNTPAWYGRVAAKIADHYAARATPPRFIEIFNEPDSARFWQGTASAFAILYQHAFDLGPAGKKGGSGFTQDTGVTAFNTPSSVPNTAFASAGQARFDFVSVHHYGDGIGTTPSQTVARLDAARGELNTFCAANGWAACPPLHVSEWNVAANAPRGVYGEPATAGFTSAFLTLAQDPSYRIRAAHFYAGSRSLQGMHLGHSTATAPFYGFTIRPSAFAMSMHAGLAGNPLVQLRLRDTLKKPNLLVPMLDFARGDGLVTAYASKNGAARYLVITNTGATARAIHLSLTGMAGLHTLTERRLLAQPSGGVEVGAHAIGGVWFPNELEVDARYADPSLFSTASTAITPVANAVDVDLTIGAYEVIRLEATP